MKHVIRRMFFLMLCMVLLAGCSAVDQRDALSVGDQSISEDGLTDLIFALNPESPERETVPVLDIDPYRTIGAGWLRLYAAVEYLEGQGIVLDEQGRQTATELIEQQISEGRYSPLSRESEAYEALIVNHWMATNVADLETPEAQIAMETLLRDSDVASRIGSFDIDANLIGPRG